MVQYSIDKDLNTFYDEHVCLGTTRRNQLAGKRDACLGRLRDGLKLLADKRGVIYKPFARSVNQGSYAMHTLNQHPEGEYDIDVAVVFAAPDLPTTALEARKRIADALLEAGGGFLTEPEARTNAVTVWYADGTHVDLAIYREVTTFSGTKLEHAGADWGDRNPTAITEWFNNQVDTRSPSLPADVRKQQLRRIVRWVKAFARSRVSWSLPGGMILTTLVAEVYASDSSRDDVALMKTLRALKYRLAASVDVNNPVNVNASLTSKSEIKAQVNNLLKKLDKALEWLSVLEEAACTREKALRAWGKFFNHEFWGASAEAEGPAEDVVKNDAIDLRLDVGIARSNNGPTMPYTLKQRPVAKKRHIHFTIPPEWRDLADVEYRWTVRNTGDEAVAAKQEQYTLTGGSDCWRTAAYQGIHTMTCEIISSNRVIARGVRRVHIGRW